MLRKAIEGIDSPLVRAVNEVGDGWMLLILWAAYHNTSRFDDFQRELGVARNILAERLRRLVDNGLMEKRPIADGARRMEYRLTAKGQALEETLRLLYDWGDSWAATARGEALRAAE